MYKQGLHSRCDDEGLAYYFSADDFADMAYRPYYFKSSRNHILRGCFYYYPQPVQNKLIVFDHGFGGGHRSYMKEIEKLCKAGYLVFSYDHTGCMESEGDSPNGLAQSLVDLNDCINALRADTKYKDFEINVVGHSWGGFSTLNIGSLHNDITKIVVLSGFTSVERLVNSYFGGIMKPYRKAIMEVERVANPDFVDFDAVESLKKTDAKALLIYSADDKLCVKAHYDALVAGLEGKENVTFHLEESKGHNPNYTEDAVQYLAKYQAQLKKMKKKLDTPKKKSEFVESWDWDRMTAQDGRIWDMIIDFLKK